MKQKLDAYVEKQTITYCQQNQFNNQIQQDLINFLTDLAQPDHGQWEQAQANLTNTLFDNQNVLKILMVEIRNADNFKKIFGGAAYVFIDGLRTSFGNTINTDLKLDEFIIKMKLGTLDIQQPNDQGQQLPVQQNQQQAANELAQQIEKLQLNPEQQQDVDPVQMRLNQFYDAKTLEEQQTVLNSILNYHCSSEWEQFQQFIQKYNLSNHPAYTAQYGQTDQSSYLPENMQQQKIQFAPKIPEAQRKLLKDMLYWHDNHDQTQVINYYYNLLANCNNNEQQTMDLIGEYAQPCLTDIAFLFNNQ